MGDTEEGWRSSYLSVRKAAVGSSQTTNRRRLERMGFAGLDSGGIWLDLGAGDGNLVTTLAGLGVSHIVALEYQLDLVRHCPRSASVVCGSAVQVPLADESVDVVVVMDVLHHLSSADLAPGMEEIHRVLRPGGQLLVCEPAQTAVRWVLNLALMSPLSNLTAFSRDKRSMVEAEADTLYPWLASERSFSRLAAQLGFDQVVGHRGAMSSLSRFLRR